MKCQKLFEIIDELKDKYINMVEDVCNIESPSDFKPGVDKVAYYFAEYAEKKGWKVEVLKQNVSGDVVCITLNPDAKEKPISLSAHIDTVHELGLFGTPAVRREGNIMYGPGVTDCKGNAVAAMLVLDALEKCGFDKRPVMLLLQTDEEVNSVPSNRETINYICNKSLNSIAFLNLEAHTPGFAILQTKGILRYEIKIKGLSVHSAACVTGANAIAEAAYKIIEIEKIKDPDTVTCNCSIIKGGTAPNNVADECSFVVDIRYCTPEQKEDVMKKIEKIADTTTVDGCSATFKITSDRPAMFKSQKNYDLLDTVNEIFNDIGLPVLTPKLTLGGTDGAYATEFGIPCIDGIGITGGRIHSPEEFLYTDTVAQAAKRIASIVYCI